MNFPSELKYTKTHEWARKEGDRISVGITEYAQKEISDVVFVEVPKLDVQTQQGKAAAVVESVKAAFDIYSPVSGKIIDVNRELDANPGLVNQDPYGQGWFFSVQMQDESEWDKLMSSQDYQNFLKQNVK